MHALKKEKIMLKEKITFVVAFAISFQLAFAQLPEIMAPIIPSSQTSIYISTEGNDLNTGIFSSPVATFQKAIELIPFNSSGDVYGEIVYLEGDYYPSQALRQDINQHQMGNSFKNVSIRGEGNVNIHGDSTLVNNHLVVLRGSGIKIENINFLNARGIGILIANYNSNGVLTQASKINNVLIKDVSVDETLSHGIISLFVDTIMFENTIVTNSAQENTGVNGNCQWGSALKASYCQQIIVRNCATFHNRGEGIAIASSTNALVESCKSYDNFSGNIYCIRTNKAIFKKNLLYNRDSLYWRNCRANQTGVAQERKPSNGFSISNEVNYDDFFSNACVPERIYQNGLFSNKLADSIFFYNNILILAPLRIVDESDGNCFFPQFSRANNFSNIYIENNTFIGDISAENEFLNKDPIVSMTFDQSYFWGCFPNVTGIGKYTVENIVFKNNIISLNEDLNGESISPTRIFYGGRPCNGGFLQDHISSMGNLWHHQLSPIWDAYAATFIPNFLYGTNDTIDNEMITYCEPEFDIENLMPDSISNVNHFFKKEPYADYITQDYWGNVRDVDNAGLSNVGAIEHMQIVNTIHEQIEQESIKIFPNPSQNNITITSTEPFSEDLNIKVFNAIGKIQSYNMKRIDSKSIQIGLNACENGIYYISIESNSSIKSYKIIKLKVF